MELGFCWPSCQGRHEGGYFRSLVINGVKRSFSHCCYCIDVSSLCELLRQITVSISVITFIMEVQSPFELNFQSQWEHSKKIWFIGPMNEVFAMEEGLVDLVENHCCPVISGHLDQILYGLYHAVGMNRTFLQEEEHPFLWDCCILVFHLE